MVHCSQYSSITKLGIVKLNCAATNLLHTLFPVFCLCRVFWNIILKVFIIWFRIQYCRVITLYLSHIVASHAKRKLIWCFFRPLFLFKFDSLLPITEATLMCFVQGFYTIDSIHTFLQRLVFTCVLRQVPLCHYSLGNNFHVTHGCIP